MTNKIAIQLGNNSLKVEGSEEFLDDVLDKFLRAVSTTPQTQSASFAAGSKTGEKVETTPKPKLAKRVPKTTSANRPKIDPNLDIIGLEEFFLDFEAKKDSERAVIFAIFLEEKLSKTKFSQDEIFSCFDAVKAHTKIPNMTSLLQNDNSRTKYFQKDDDGLLSLTVRGTNHYHQVLSQSRKSKKPS